MRFWWLIVWSVLLSGARCRAQDQRELLARMEKMEKRIESLEEEVAMLKAALAAAPSPSAQPPAPVQPVAPPPQAPAPLPSAASPGAPTVAQPPVSTDPTATARLMNPAISVIGNLIGALGNNPALGSPPTVAATPLEPVPSLEMAESEVGFSAAVDPYARADFFLSFGQQGVDLEEGYLTFHSLPAGFLVKGGKMRTPFGKVNTFHRHVLPWVDRPLVTHHLVGGEEGISDAGFLVSHLLPAPGGLFLEATGGVFRGDSEGVFEAARRSDVSVVAHLKGYGDLTENSNFELGLSYARGHNGLPIAGNGAARTFVTNLYGIDATYRWKPLRRAVYRSVVGRSEFIWSQRREAGGLRNAFGFFASAEYQFAKRWFAGFRFDNSERPQAGNLRDSGVSAILTYWPSEFSQIRAQYRFTDYFEGLHSNELLFQFQFSVGAHGAHPF